jgi:hypothetical protein
MCCSRITTSAYNSCCSSGAIIVGIGPLNDGLFAPCFVHQFILPAPSLAPVVALSIFEIIQETLNWDPSIILLRRLWRRRIPILGAILTLFGLGMSNSRPYTTWVIALNGMLLWSRPSSYTPGEYYFTNASVAAPTPSAAVTKPHPAGRLLPGELSPSTLT